MSQAPDRYELPGPREDAKWLDPDTEDDGLTPAERRELDRLDREEAEWEKDR